MYPSDFYGPKGRQYYGNEGWDFDANAFNKVLNYKNKPDAKVTIFRAVPKSVYKEAMKSESPLKQLIQPGDWITLSKEYAKAHGESALNNDYKIVSKMVPARQVWTNADSIHEWGYHPDTPKETGALTREAPQDEALRLAQQRAALPPAQGGLGLPANNTPMDRAKAMEWNDDWLHGTSSDITLFKPNPTYMTTDPSLASDYSIIRARGSGSPNVMPLISQGEMVGPKEYDQAELEIKKSTGKGYVPSKDIHSELAKKGFAGYKEGDLQIVFDPSTLRSRFAAFDPWRRDAATAAAMGVAAPDLLAKEKTEEPPNKKKKPEGALSTVTQ
jgi:hypothetical protein